MSEFNFKTASFTAAFATLVFVTFFFNSNVAGAASDGAKIFADNCSACHTNGGNNIEPKKPVKGSKMLSSKQSLKQFLLKPTGSMTPFPQIANADGDLTALYNYCKTLK